MKKKRGKTNVPKRKSTSKKAKPKRITRKPEKTKVRETAESKYIRLAGRRTRKLARSRYTTKSFLSRDGVFRTIRKKQYSAKHLSLEQIVRANKNFTIGNSVFARVAFKSKDDQIIWRGVPRQKIENEAALEGVISLLMLYANEYSGKRDSIVGFDIEKTLSEFDLELEKFMREIIKEMEYLWRALRRADGKKLQQSKADVRIGPKKAKKVRGVGSRNK